MARLPVIVLSRSETVKQALVKTSNTSTNTLSIHICSKKYKPLIKSARPIQILYASDNEKDMPEMIYNLISDNVAILLNPKNNWYEGLGWRCVNYVTPRAAIRYFCAVDPAPPALLTATNEIKLRVPGYMITAASITLPEIITARNVEIAINASVNLLQDRDYVTDLIIPASLLSCE